MSDDQAGASAPASLTEALERIRSRTIVVRGAEVTLTSPSAITAMRIRRAMPRPSGDRTSAAYAADDEFRSYLILSATVGVAMGLEVDGIQPAAMLELPDEVLAKKVRPYAMGVARLLTEPELLALSRAIAELSESQRVEATGN